MKEGQTINRHVIGIDPGVCTGFAVYDRGGRALIVVESFPILEAMAKVLEWKGQGVELRFEDARLRRWFGKKDREVLQGAGSIKRDCQIWEDFCHLHQIKVTHIPPMDNLTKLNAGQFAKLTGWEGRTNEHGRDAAMLVFGA